MTDFEMDQALRQMEVPEAREEWKSKVKTQMKKNPWKRRILIAGLAACAALGAAFQEAHFGSAGMENDKMKISLALRVEPAYSKFTWLGLDSSMSGSADWSTRVFFDRSRQEVFGYEFKVKPIDGGKFEMEFQALREDPRQGKAQQYRWTGVDALPSKRVVGQSEAVKVELKHEGNTRLIDEVTATGNFESFEASMRKAPMRLIGAKLFVDGKLLLDGRGGSCSGTYAVLYFPGDKNIQLGLDEGKKNDMVPVGWVDGAVLEFYLDGQKYRIESSEAIADGGRRTLYGVVKPNQEEKGPGTFGSAG